MSNVATEVLADNDMPCWAVPTVKLFLNLRRDIFLDGVFLKSARRDIDSFLLHLVGHVDVLDYSLWQALLSCTCDIASRRARDRSLRVALCVGHLLEGAG